MEKSETNKRYMLLLAALSIVSVITFLGCTLFNTKGEPREAVVALSMLNTGDWISPINNGVDIAYKPPFFHWCIALISLVTGKVTEFTARIPSALAMIAMLLVLFRYQLANRVDCKTAFLSGLITMTSFEVHRGAMACRVDMMLAALTVIAICLLHEWFALQKKTAIIGAVICMSCALLTKGPVGVILPCLVVGVYRLVRGANILHTIGFFFLIAICSCLIPALWYYLAYLERGDAFLYLVYEENILRFTGKMVYSSHEAPAIYNVFTLLSGLLPYTLILLFSLFVLKYHKPESLRLVDIWTKAKHWVKSMSDHDLLAILSFVLIFVFYCIPKSKRSVYLLPVYPFIAYFIARYIMFLAREHRKLISSFGWFLSVLSILLLVLYTAIKAELIPETIFHGKHAAENIAYLQSIETSSIGAAAILASIVSIGTVLWFICRGRKGSPYSLSLSLVSLVFTILFTLDGLVLPPILNTKSDKDVATQIASLTPHGVTIWDYRKDDIPGGRNLMHQFSVNFYLGDHIRPLYTGRPKAGYLIMGDEDLEAFNKSHSYYKLKQIRRFEHKSCDDKRKLTLYSFETIQK